MSNTSCKECIFADYDGVTQIGCKRNMLDKYRRNKADIIEAYDAEKEFYVIKNRYCPFYRTQEWMDRAGDNFEQMLQEENTLSFHVIVFATDDIEQLEDTLESLKEQQGHKMVTVIRAVTNMIKPQDMKIVLDQYVGLWRIQNTTYSDLDKDKIVHQLNSTFKNRTNYDCILTAGKRLSEGLFEKIGSSVINELFRFTMIEDGEIVIVPIPVFEHWYFQGDPDISVYGNIKAFAEKEQEKTIFQTSEIK